MRSSRIWKRRSVRHEPKSEAVRELLQEFESTSLELQPHAGKSGFSGALIWRASGGKLDLCLRGWPETESSPERIRTIHHWMREARRAGLTFVPKLWTCGDGQTCIKRRGRLWDVSQWMSGEASFHEKPSHARLQQACRALAQLHLAWQRLDRRNDRCPGVSQRLKRAGQWHRITSQIGLIQRADQALARWMPFVPTLLAFWENQRLPLQPCLCDIWHDHVLFEKDQVSGIIDYGNAKMDHVSVDLARLLGSLIGDDEESWELGLTAYREVRPLTVEEEAFARVLDRTGVVIAVWNWIRWWVIEKRSLDESRAEQRLTSLLDRMESWRS